MKHMKKSMFITTLAMVVVLVVALSTATFAWYTAQSNVTITQTAISSAASSNAAIAVDTKLISETNAGTSVDITLSSTVDPMIPSTDLSAVGNATTAPVFVSAPVNAQNAFTLDGTTATPATIQTAKGYQDASPVSASSFYVGNTNANKTVDVGVTVTVTPNGYRETKIADETAFNGSKSTLFTTTDKLTFTSCASASYDPLATYYTADTSIAGFLRVALYYSTTGSDYHYIGTWASTAAATAYGSIVSGQTATIADAAGIDSFNAIASGNASANTINLVGNVSVQIKAFVWFDGTLLTADHSKATCSFTIGFAAA